MSKLRIIAGKLKNQPVLAPDNRDITHPMGERERSAIFNSLMSVVKDAKVLDAFAGTGALGLEALSRGASTVTFLEKEPVALRVLRQNIANLGQEADCRVVKNLSQISETFDLVFADPPYDNPQFDIVADILIYLKTDGYFVLSHAKDIAVPEFENLSLLFDRTYARANIKIYQKLV